MFTGLVEELGTVWRVEPRGGSLRLWIGAREVVRDVHVGDSLCVNGVCLTVTAFDPEGFVCDVMEETLRRTNLRGLRPGEPVNLERALRADGRFGGHIVQGHVDGLGIIAQRRPRQGSVLWEVTAPPAVLRYVAPKGSIAVEGISLTVIERRPASFTFSTIPHTLAVTTLGHRQVGQTVNLEADILAKYLESLLRARLDPGPGLTWEFLAEHGFK